MQMPRVMDGEPIPTTEALFHAGEACVIGELEVVVVLKGWRQIEDESRRPYQSLL